MGLVYEKFDDNQISTCAVNGLTLRAGDVAHGKRLRRLYSDLDLLLNREQFYRTEISLVSLHWLQMLQ